MPRFEYVTPILCVADVTASIAYYRESGDPDGHRLRFSMSTDLPSDGVALRED